MPGAPTQGTSQLPGLPVRTAPRPPTLTHTNNHTKRTGYTLTTHTRTIQPQICSDTHMPQALRATATP
jgi:hypothetical protein